MLKNHFQHFINLHGAFIQSPFERDGRLSLRLSSILLNKSFSPDERVSLNGHKEVTRIFGEDFANTTYNSLIEAWKNAKLDRRDEFQMKIKDAFAQTKELGINPVVLYESVRLIFRVAALACCRTREKAYDAGFDSEYVESGKTSISFHDKSLITGKNFPFEKRYNFSGSDFETN